MAETTIDTELDEEFVGSYTSESEAPRTGQGASLTAPGQALGRGVGAHESRCAPKRFQCLADGKIGDDAVGDVVQVVLDADRLGRKQGHCSLDLARLELLLVRQLPQLLLLGLLQLLQSRPLRLIFRQLLNVVLRTDLGRSRTVPEHLHRNRVHLSNHLCLLTLLGV